FPFDDWPLSFLVVRLRHHLRPRFGLAVPRIERRRKEQKLSLRKFRGPCRLERRLPLSTLHAPPARRQPLRCRALFLGCGRKVLGDRPPKSRQGSQAAQGLEGSPSPALSKPCRVFGGPFTKPGKGWEAGRVLEKDGLVERQRCGPRIEGDESPQPLRGQRGRPRKFRGLGQDAKRKGTLRPFDQGGDLSGAGPF